MPLNPSKIALTALIALLGATGTVPLNSLVSLPSQVLAQTVEERKAEADRLREQGIEQFQTSQYPAAIESWEKALAIYREIKDRNGEAASLNNYLLMGLGVAYYSLGQYPKAIEYYQQSLAISKDIGDREGEAGSLMGLGDAYLFLGQYAKALEFYQQSLAIQKEIGDKNGEARSLNNLGGAYKNLGQYAQAEQNL